MANSWGYPRFIHHDRLYSPNNSFVKNDMIFLCVRIVRGDSLPTFPTEFHRNFFAAYKRDLHGNAILKVADKTFKV
jgi:hypothetical protein